MSTPDSLIALGADIGAGDGTAASALLFTLLCTLASQVAQKSVSLRFVASGGTNSFHFHARAPLFWFALVSLGLGLLSWLLVLTHWPVSTAYPLLSINYILMQIAARFVFGETITWRQSCGVLLIVLGVCLVSGVLQP